MSIVLEGLTKRFGRQVVVDRVSLSVSDGEMFVLLGASGSGKSTILRMIAGLSLPEEGRILLRGEDVTYLTPQKRGIGFVFQNYSIFRHMSVTENIEFGLKIRKVPAGDRARRRDQLLELVGLAGLGSRYASQLSGGQQQLVALSRALAYEPSVLLLDEPFGALDVKIRAQLRRSLKNIHDSLGITTVLVTHDQEEAFELADRIGVIDRGHILEVGDPETLYARPRTVFVATFLGTGNVLRGRAEGPYARFGDLSLPIPEDLPHEEGSPVQLLFRPEQVRLTREHPGTDTQVLGRGRILEQTFAGATRRLRLRLPRLAGTRQVTPALPFGEDGMLVDAVQPSDLPSYEEEFWVELTGWQILEPPPSRLLVFDPGGGSPQFYSIVRQLTRRLHSPAVLLGVAQDPEGGEKISAAIEENRHAQRLDPSEVRIRFGNPADQILGEQNESLYRMLVLSPRPRKNAEGTAERPDSGLVSVLERSIIPVLVARGDRSQINRILICTAAGEPGKRDVRVGGRLARKLGASVTLLYVTKGSEQASSLAVEHMERAASTLRGLDLEVEVRMVPAPTPLKGILAEAREGHHDLIVMGRHSPGGRSLFGLDDVTLQVLSGSDIPILVVPSEAP